MVRIMIKRWRAGLADVLRFRVRPIRPTRLRLTTRGTNPGDATGDSLACTLPLDTLILDHVNDAVIATDPELRILSWNRAAEAIYGWQAAEVLGKALPEIIPVNSYLDGSDRETVLAEMHRASLWKGEVVQRHRDGRELVIEASSRVIRDAQGRTVGLVSVNRDITERTRTQDALYDSEARFYSAFDYA